MTLSLLEKAALLGLTGRELLQLFEVDQRYADDSVFASAGAVARFRRWDAAGRPPADLERLEFVGDDRVHASLSDTLRSLPAAVATHAVGGVLWVEIGRSAIGWACEMPAPPHPEGDRLHLIAISGSVSDEALPGLIGHELAHSWHRHVSPVSSRQTGSVSDAEWTQRCLKVMSTAELAHHRIAGERLADRTAEAWGLHIATAHSSDEVRLADFRAEIAAVAGSDGGTR